nr:Chain P, optimized p53 peptide [unidentified]
RFMDYWEGL